MRHGRARSNTVLSGRGVGLAGLQAAVGNYLWNSRQTSSTSEVVPTAPAVPLAGRPDAGPFRLGALSMSFSLANLDLRYEPFPIGVAADHG